MPLKTAVLTGRTVARLARHVDVALGEVDLSLSQYRMLMYLADGAEMATVLADKLAVTPPSVTKIVDGLVGRGLVERRANPGDRRQVGHAITEEGRAALAQADAAVARRLDAIAAHVPAARRADAVDDLDLWRAAMDDYRAAKIGGTT